MVGTKAEETLLERFQARSINDVLTKAILRLLRRLDSHPYRFWSTLPVPIDSIVEAHDIAVETVSIPDGKLAFAIPSEHRLRIQISNNLSEQRRRVVLAHELGHLLFYRKGEDGELRHITGLLDRREVEFEEHVCNEFARSLLLPRWMLVQEIRRLAPTRPAELLRCVEMLATKFGVDTWTLVNRLRSVHIEKPSAVIFLFSHHSIADAEPTATSGSSRLGTTAWAYLGSLKSVWFPDGGSPEGLPLNSPRLLMAEYERVRGEIDSWSLGVWQLVTLRQDNGENDVQLATEVAERLTIRRNSRGKWIDEEVNGLSASCLVKEMLAPGFVLSAVMFSDMTAAAPGVLSGPIALRRL